MERNPIYAVGGSEHGEKKRRICFSRTNARVDNLVRYVRASICETNCYTKCRPTDGATIGRAVFDNSRDLYDTADRRYPTASGTLHERWTKRFRRIEQTTSGTGFPTGGFPNVPIRRHFAGVPFRRSANNCHGTGPRRPADIGNVKSELNRRRPFAVSPISVINDRSLSPK